MRTRDLLLLLALTLLFTGLGSLKPIHVDEAANYYYAAQIAEHPLDPYGFTVFWYQDPEPANYVLTPPVLVYWWAAAVRLFGDQPVLWKLWLLPFALILVFSLHALFRRFADGLEMPLTWMTVLSPALLPSLNLMPDVPALAGSLLAVAVFLRACDRGSLALAVWAGLLAGLAMQTKYTAFLVPAVLLLRAVLVRRLGLGLLAAVLATAVFVAWEGLVYWRYGDSHFWLQVTYAPHSMMNKVVLLLPLLPITGAVASVIGLLGLAALGSTPRVIGWAAAAMALGYVTLVCIDARYTAVVTLAPWLGGTVFDGEFTLAYLIFGLVGLVLAAIHCRLATAAWKQGPDGRFLVLWLGLELAGSIALSPFPAVRRVLGLVVVLTLLAGRLARGDKAGGRLEEPSHPPVSQRTWLVWSLVAGNVALGLFYYAVDLRDAQAEKQAAEEAARLIRAHDGGTIWYVGHWGFQFYAEHAGMVPVVPHHSQLRAGDWLVLPGPPIDRQHIELKGTPTEHAFDVRVEDGLPLRTVVGYYGGAEPLTYCRGPRLEVEVRRVLADWVPIEPAKDR
jgi:hypothetical protein